MPEVIDIDDTSNQDTSAVIEEKESTETIEEAATETAEGTSNVTTKTELDNTDNPSVTEEDEEPEKVKHTPDFMGEEGEPEADEDASTEERAKESLEKEQPPEWLKLLQIPSV